MAKTKAIIFSSVAAAIFLFPFLAKASEDVTPPVVTSFSITPETIDTTSGDQTLTLTMTVEDEASDICLNADQGCSINSLIVIEPISSMGYLFGPFQLVSGNMRSGTFTSQLTLPQGSRIGPWNLSYIWIFDSSENSRQYTPWRYPSYIECGSGTNGVCMMSIFSDIPGITGTVIGNSGSTDSFLIDAEYSMINPLGGTKVTFPAGTTITKADGGSFEIYKLVNQESSVSGLTTSGLTGNVAEVLKLGIPGLKLSFSQPVRIDLKVDESLSGKNLTLKSLSDGDASWAGEGSCKVDEDTCTFSISHASYFAALSKKKVKATGPKLSFSAKKRVKKSQVRLKIKTNKNSLLDISVNGNTQKTVLASKKGKYTYRANLEMGQNTITVTSTGSGGTISRSRIVTRR